MARPRGRPPFKPTPTQRRQVSIAAGGGMRHNEIALAIGIDIKTLEKHFELELSVGAVQRRMEVLVAMQRAAAKGNVSAQKAYMALVPEVGIPPLSADGEVPTAGATQGDPKLTVTAGQADQVVTPMVPPQGKKEAAQAAAKTAQVGTDWADLLPGPVSQLQ